MLLKKSPKLLGNVPPVADKKGKKRQPGLLQPQAARHHHKFTSKTHQEMLAHWPQSTPVAPLRTKPLVSTRLSRVPHWVQGCQPWDLAPPLSPSPPGSGSGTWGTTGRLLGPGLQTCSACRVANGWASPPKARDAQSTSKSFSQQTPPWGSGSRADCPGHALRGWLPPCASRASLAPTHVGLAHYTRVRVHTSTAHAYIQQRTLAEQCTRIQHAHTQSTARIHAYSMLHTPRTHSRTALHVHTRSQGTARACTALHTYTAGTLAQRGTRTRAAPGSPSAARTLSGRTGTRAAPHTRAAQPAPEPPTP